MKTLSTLAALSAWRQQQQSSEKSIALVPTMGNLHDGHLSLVKLAKAQADRCLVSIFVNPTQFGPQEDFDAYPRTLTEDLELLALMGADAVFAPSEPGILYASTPIGLTAPPELARHLCGKFRPGHFDGVLQIVNKLFNLCTPDLAIFGEKDYQQLLLIRTMVADFFQPITIMGAPIIREASGLAMSSRNRYLSEKEKNQASALYAHLNVTKASLLAGSLKTATQQQAHCAQQIDSLNAIGFQMQYYEICDAQTLTPIATPHITNHQTTSTDMQDGTSREPIVSSAREATQGVETTDTPQPNDQNHSNKTAPFNEFVQELVIVAAGYFGQTRLIDNIQVQVSPTTL